SYTPRGQHRFSDVRAAGDPEAILVAVSGLLAHVPNPAPAVQRNTLRFILERAFSVLEPRSTGPDSRWTNHPDMAGRCASSFGQRCFTLGLGPCSVDQVR